MSRAKQFFSSLSKNKKITALVLLFLFFATIVLPSTVFAADQPPTAETCELSWWGKIKESLADSIAIAIMPFITGALWLGKQLSIIFGNLSLFTIDKVLNWNITTVEGGDNWAQVWINGWISMKDIANMAIVLGFVVAGIAITLRIQDYGAKKFLIPLIIVALLINFSGLLVGIVIDAGTIITKYLTRGGIATQGNTIMDKLQTSERDILCQEIKANNYGQYYMTIVYFLFIYYYAAIALWYLSFAIIDRYIILGFMFMLSPLAFVCAVLPFSEAKKLWGMWLDTFSKQAFIGVGLAFVLYISGKLLEAFEITPQTELSDVVFYLSIVLSVIIVGTRMTRVTGTMVARFLSGTVRAVVNTAVFAGQIALAVATGGASAAGMAGLRGTLMRTGAGMLSKATGGATTETGQRVLGTAGQFLERIGAKREGSTDEAAQNRVAEKAKQKSTAFAAAKERNDTVTMDRIRNEARNGRGIERAAAVQAIVDNKDLHRTFRDARDQFDPVAASRSLDYARSAGAIGIREKAAKQAPTIEGENTEAINRMMTSHPRWSRDEARQEVIVRVAIKTPEEELDRTFVDSMNSETLSIVAGRMSNRKREVLVRNNLESLRQERKALASGRAERAALSPEDLEKWRELAEKERFLRHLPTR